MFEGEILKYTLFIMNHFIRNLHVEGPKIVRARTTNENVTKELFNVDYFYHCKQSRIRSWFLSFAVKIHMHCTLREYQMFPRLVSTFADI